MIQIRSMKKNKNQPKIIIGKCTIVLKKDELKEHVKNNT